MYYKNKYNKNDQSFDITQVEGVTPEIIAEYKRLVRHERYLLEKEQKMGIILYEQEDQIEYLLKHEDNIISFETHKMLYEALDSLYAKNKSWYEAVICYYYYYETSYSTLAKMFGVSKQTMYSRVHNGIKFLRDIMK